MDKPIVIKFLPALLSSVLAVAAFCYSGNAQAMQTTNSAGQVQLATYYNHGNYYPRNNIYIGGYPRGYIYFGNGFYPNPYWNTYRPSYNIPNYNCQRRCLVDKWSGRVIRCAQTCY